MYITSQVYIGPATYQPSSKDGMSHDQFKDIGLSPICFLDLWSIRGLFFSFFFFEESIRDLRDRTVSNGGGERAYNLAMEGQKEDQNTEFQRDTDESREMDKNWGETEKEEEDKEEGNDTVSGMGINMLKLGGKTLPIGLEQRPAKELIDDPTQDADKETASPNVSEN
ncbi:hypothetical protein V6N11_059384 [Hibiscus sabdariffa]|uniref:Uncharacterized protein n=1 Tax=Hibiscus sabdariffa TaxID=183260 RepID=A0ABR2AE93_9ROSI